MKRLLPLILLAISHVCLAQDEVSITSGDLTLYGTLLRPAEPGPHAVLLIAGSGNTDRDGNTPSQMVTPNGLKMVAESLSEAGITTLRYDKRGVGKSVNDGLKMEDLRLEQYAEDAAQWIAYLKQDYEHVTVIGHSLGGLIGMLAIQKEPADRLVTLAGLAENIHTTLTHQLGQQPMFVLEAAAPIMDSLKAGVRVDSVPPFLNSLFHPKIQGYLMSMMKYDPQEEIGKLTIPVLVVQGTHDLQITQEAALSMSEQTPYARLLLVDSMNHVLKSSPADPAGNMATYNDPERPLHSELMPALRSFILQPAWYEPLLLLTGTWQVEGKNMYETWAFDKEKQAFTGRSYRLHNGQEQVMETLAIVQEGERILYKATVPNQNAGSTIPFTYTSEEAPSLLFTNPAHDFPQAIKYTLQPDGHLRAEVSGGGRGFTLKMIRRLN